VGSVGGYGYGDSYGYGYGDGYGYGTDNAFVEGYGYGFGCGYGYGHGEGYGEGYGEGIVPGYGDGYARGFGDGYGSGTGYGDRCRLGAGVGAGGSGYWAEVSLAYSHLCPPGATLAWWWSGADASGHSWYMAWAGRHDVVSGPLKLCTTRALHATTDPDDPDWRGDRLWVVALHGDVARDSESSKIGALERTILAEVGR
jgi:hypothetical protein